MLTQMHRCSFICKTIPKTMTRSLLCRDLSPHPAWTLSRHGRSIHLRAQWSCSNNVPPIVVGRMCSKVSRKGNSSPLSLIDSCGAQRGAHAFQRFLSQSSYSGYYTPAHTQRQPFYTNCRPNMAAHTSCVCSPALIRQSLYKSIAPTL